jgi:RimJ/RimL family protein N-acetyltransferase
MSKIIQEKTVPKVCRLTFFCCHDVPRLLKMQSDVEFARLRQASGLASSEKAVLNWLSSSSLLQGKSKVTMAVRDSFGPSLFGYISVEISSPEASKGILGIFLGPQSSSGSGSTALLEMEKIALEVMELSIIEAHVLDTNLKAINFFAKNQYQPVLTTETQKVFQKNLRKR